MYAWTSEDIEQILIQLDAINLPFAKYSFVRSGTGLTLLGKGASANVYRAYRKNSKKKIKKNYAIKVIGFGGNLVDFKAFRETAEAQKNLAISNDNIVKIYGYTELRVWIENAHTVAKAEVIDPEETTSPDGDFLRLQFIVMEELELVIQYSEHGKPSLNPAKLAALDEQEILTITYDISMALNAAHNKGLLHRDVKLENVFYDKKKKMYKLGDFGIAKQTSDGMASTVAFTKGYGAPEVVFSSDDKYDNTADIYSLGMMIYVLLNDLRFPQSNSYNVNLKEQYCKGYVPPKPLMGSADITEMVLKMVSFNPDDRYQSMKEVLNEIDKLNYGGGLKYSREHNVSSIIVSAAFCVFGMAIYAISGGGDTKTFSVWLYLLFTLCTFKTISCIIDKNKTIIDLGVKKATWFDLGIFIIGVLTLIVGGFSWGVMILIILAIISETVVGMVSLIFLTENFASLITMAAGIDTSFIANYKWVGEALLILALILLFQYEVFEVRDRELIINFIDGKKRIGVWSMVIAGFVLALIIGLTLGNIENIKIALFGLAFCIIWLTRKRIMRIVEEVLEEE